jgi:hypothetical protein
MASNENSVANYITTSEFAESPKSAKKRWRTPELQILEIEGTAGGVNSGFAESTDFVPFGS